MPAVLVLILCVVHAAIRREGLPAFSASNMTAGELVGALQMAREVGEAQKLVPGEAKATEDPAVEPTATDENVTALSSARHIKYRTRRRAIFDHAATFLRLALGKPG